MGEAQDRTKESRRRCDYKTRGEIIQDKCRCRKIQTKFIRSAKEQIFASYLDHIAMVRNFESNFYAPFLSEKRAKY